MSVKGKFSMNEKKFKPFRELDDKFMRELREKS